MKPILVDEFVKDADVETSTSIVIDGITYNGYQIAKPLNYDPEYFSYKDRLEMADAVLQGKAIAVRYFCDLSEAEQVEYVKAKLAKAKTVIPPPPQAPKNTFRREGERPEPITE